MHPALQLGFEVVTATLPDGMAVRERVRLFALEPDGLVAVISVEDIIADRVGQYTSGSADDMLGQARALFALFPDVDLTYLDTRVRYESMGDHDLAILKA